jgi:hypothetical protein
MCFCYYTITHVNLLWLRLLIRKSDCQKVCPETARLISFEMYRMPIAHCGTTHMQENHASGL